MGKACCREDAFCQQTMEGSTLDKSTAWHPESAGYAVCLIEQDILLLKMIDTIYMYNVLCRWSNTVEVQ